MKHIVKMSVLCLACTFLSIGTQIPEAGAESLKLVKLPSPDTVGGKPLMETLKARKSSRGFAQTKLPIDKLSSLLWAAQGINRPQTGQLTAPSARNLQEIDLYVALQEGLYLYDKKGHSLSLVKDGDIREAIGKQEFTQKAPVGLIYVADLSKISSGEPDATFYSAADTGFISQNVYLFCASENLATVVLGWVDKPALAKKMDLRKDQKVILTQPVGYPE